MFLLANVFSTIILFHGFHTQHLLQEHKITSMEIPPSGNPT